MLGRRHLKLTVMAGAVGLMTSPAMAQDAAQPAEGALPEVEVIQKKAPPAAKKKAAPAPKAASPAPQPPPAYDYVDAEPAPGGQVRGADGRAAGNAPNISPVDRTQGILPQDLQNYAGAGTVVTTAQIEEQRPLNNHELLSRVPGVTIVADDGFGRHSGIGLRGSPVRRSRKVLVMEDGVPINFSAYLDPSTHYTPPTERVESVEVLRGTIVAYGPLNNHGVVNFRNLNPFGANETVITAALGHTDGSDRSVNNYRHVHTRQNLGNVGVVASYSGGDAGGSWNNEDLGYNDFYGALGFRGSNQDLTISGGYFRQRDDYDEINFRGTEADFYRYGREKSNRPGSGFATSGNTRATDYNTYNADLYRIQATHNWYINSNTTLSTQFFYNHNERNRFEARGGGPDNPPDGHMRGRERTYEFYGADSRIEFAKIPIFAGITADFQGGVRVERHKFDNCNSVGLRGQRLGADRSGNCFASNAAVPPPLGVGGYPDSGRFVTFEADVFSAFIQTAIHVTRDLTITPGVRFENYDITRNGIYRPEAPATAGISESDHSHVLPGIGFAWEAAHRTTVYGGFHQGITPQVARGPAFPLPDEEGDNYQIGVRSTAVRGLTFDLAYFHSNIENYQIKSPLNLPSGNNLYGTVDEVEINGFEIYSRLDSRPFTGGPWNFFGEAVYTFSDSEIKRGEDRNIDISGNRVPEVPRHFASLTLGFEHRSGFDVSVTGAYHGEFFTDALNTAPYTCVNDDGELRPACNSDAVVGKVDGQWLLSARANYHIPDTGLTLFVSGQNLTNEFYISDFEGGAKPGIGRTLWAGFTYKFDN